MLAIALWWSIGYCFADPLLLQYNKKPHATDLEGQRVVWKHVRNCYKGLLLRALPSWEHESDPGLGHKDRIMMSAFFSAAKAVNSSLAK